MDLETTKTELPIGAKNSQIGPSETSFAQIVAESKANLAAEQASQIKRGPGRPKGTTKIIQPEPSGEPKSEKMGSTVSPEDKKAVEDLSKEMQPLLSEAIKTPFAIAGQYFRNSEIEITDDDAKTPAYYLSKWLRYQLPELENAGPKMFSLYAFLISTTLVFLKKLPKMIKPKKQFIYDSTVVSSSPAPTDTEPAAGFETEPLPRPPTSMHAADFFHKGTHQ